MIVVESSAARRSVFLSGTAANFAKAFGATIEQHEHDGGTYRGRSGDLTVPADLAPIIEGVFGIDNRPVAKPHFQRGMIPPGSGLQPHANGGSFSPVQLAKLYNFPAGLDGTGPVSPSSNTGGGYRTADIRAYFHKLGLPVPNVKSVRIDGGATTSPRPGRHADGEVMLDIEVAAAVAPKAQIAVYFAPNTDKGFIDAVTKAVHDTTNKPSVISISWGGPESNWTAQAMRSFDQALQTAGALGVSVCCAAGDNGSGDGVTDRPGTWTTPHPAPIKRSSCGGTKLIAIPEPRSRAKVSGTHYR